MADWRRPDAARLINGAGEGEGMSPSPILYLDVLDQLELPDADSDQWWISRFNRYQNPQRAEVQGTSLLVRFRALMRQLRPFVACS